MPLILLHVYIYAISMYIFTHIRISAHEERSEIVRYKNVCIPNVFWLESMKNNHSQHALLLYYRAMSTHYILFENKNMYINRRKL